jgi:transposase
VQAPLRQIAFLDREIEAVERQIAEMLSSPEARRLMTAPGCEPDRDRDRPGGDRRHQPVLHSRRLVAHLGLGPRVRQSGEQPARSGHISKRGSASARRALVEATWSVVCEPGPLRPNTSASEPAAATERRSSSPRASVTHHV